MTDTPYLTYKQAAHYLSVPIGTLYAWVYEKRIPHFRLSGRTVRIKRADLDAWAADRIPEAAAREAETSNLMTYREAAGYLSVPVGTLYAWVHEKRIPHVRLSGRTVRFKRGQLDEYLQAGTVPVQKPKR